MEKARKYLESKNPEYWDIRKEERNNQYIKSENGSIEEIIETDRSGIGVRTVEKGSIGFSYTENQSNAIKTSKESYKIAKSLENQEVKLSEEETNQDQFKIDTKKPKTEKLKRIAQEIDKFSEEPVVKYSKVSINTKRPETHFMNSEGTEITQKIPYGSIGIQLRVEKNDSTAQIHESKHLSQFNAKNIREKAEEAKKEILEKAKELLKAERIQSGKRKLIMDNKMTGLFAHEALGHALEADIDSSCLYGKKNEKIAPQEFNLVSDPTRKGARGFYKYDDEGVKGKKTKLVDKGTLKNFMHSRKTAGEKERKSTGNGRAQNYSHAPITRMNNTVITAGNTDAEEMIEETKKGIYIKGSKGGSVHSSTGEFRFRAQLGYRIRDGELKEPVRGMILSGKILELLETVESIGKESKMEDVSGYCGKNGQRKPVGWGSPHIKLEKFMVS